MGCCWQVVLKTFASFTQLSSSPNLQVVFPHCGIAPDPTEVPSTVASLFKTVNSNLESFVKGVGVEISGVFTPASRSSATLPGDMAHRSLRRTDSLIAVSNFSRRIHGWSWQAFPIGMGTGAAYVTLAGLQPNPGEALKIVTDVFYFFNIVLFLLNITTFSLQLLLYPRQARRLVTDPAKGVFVPLLVLSFATIIIGTINYAVPSGKVSVNFIYGLFWTYIALSVGICFPMLMVWFNHTHQLADFTPAWAFLVFPLMLTGVVAFSTLGVIPSNEPRALGILITGYIFQGLGFFVTMFYICIYMLRIITTGFLDGAQASGAFVACGPPGFTALALMHLGENARVILTDRQLVSPLAGEVWYAASVMSALLLFGLAVFFFIFGALPYWFKLHKSLHEILGCWALTFPNVGWILAIRKIGDIFDIEGFRIWNLVMTIIMCCTWLVLFGLTAVAFWEGKIFNSNAEDVIRDMYDLNEKHLVRDLERRLSVVETSIRRVATLEARHHGVSTGVITPMSVVGAVGQAPAEIAQDRSGH